MTRDTTSNALTRLRKQYQKKDRLEAMVTLQKQTYVPARKQLDYDFHANQGPEVKVSGGGRESYRRAGFICWCRSLKRERSITIC